MAGAAAQDSAASSFDLLELQGLRAELNTRILVQNLCVLATAPLLLLAVAGMLAWPAQAMLMATACIMAIGVAALVWCHHGVRQAQIKQYLLVLAARLSSDGGWERWLPQDRMPGLLGNRWFIATKGAMLAGQVAAMLMAAWVAPPALPVLGAALALIGATAALLLSNPKEKLPPA